MDLETTGLDPDEHRILEVAVFITDFKFNEIATYHAYINQPSTQLQKMKSAPWYQWTDGRKKLRGTVYDMAQQSGVLEKLKTEGETSKSVEANLVQLVNKHFDQQAILAGNSIHQDRRFIRRWWPRLEKTLHYRMLDVSAWKVFMQGRFGVSWQSPLDHRAEEDIRGSMQELEYYLKQLPNLLKK